MTCNYSYYSYNNKNNYIPSSNNFFPVNILNDNQDFFLQVSSIEQWSWNLIKVKHYISLKAEEFGCKFITNLAINICTHFTMSEFAKQFVTIPSNLNKSKIIESNFINCGCIRFKIEIIFFYNFWIREVWKWKHCGANIVNTLFYFFSDTIDKCWFFELWFIVFLFLSINGNDDIKLLTNEYAVW